MPQKLIKKSLIEINNEKKREYRNLIDAIKHDLGIKSDVAYHNKLQHSSKLSPIEKNVFATHFKVNIDDIDFKLTKNFVS